ncbi:ATP-binding protein [Deferrisoma camini]|uniref:ATP-binding protein n=1 Tax=Deferrisoma camini TaxID=1035120 RepID=UPI00046C9F10|nr:4Fe-4S dicluster domain-containing protein [Deferrisoma camini]
MKRPIIRIDEDKCTGCGECVPNCAEGALEIRNGKAVLVKEALCDGLAACLGHCPEGALIIEERDAEPFDEELVEKRLAQLGRKAAQPQPAGCPSARVLQMRPAKAAAPDPQAGDHPSRLGQWPVQLGLLPPTAPFFRDAELLITADCVPFAFAGFHDRFLAGRAIAVACPKLDDPGAHFRKLIQIFEQGDPKSVTVVRMEVPCCGGLTGMVTQALQEAGAQIPAREVVIGRNGHILSERSL